MKQIDKVRDKIVKRNKLTSSIKKHTEFLLEMYLEGKITKLHYKSRKVELGIKWRWNEYHLDKLLNKLNKLKRK